MTLRPRIAVSAGAVVTPLFAVWCRFGVAGNCGPIWTNYGRNVEEVFQDPDAAQSVCVSLASRKSMFQTAIENRPSTDRKLGLQVRKFQSEENASEFFGSLEHGLRPASPPTPGEVGRFGRR